ncbi:MAG: glycoside hydrolase family 15 protein, partial [Actinomycetota bacterium]|nr:glycoside hydrolase family 15 protein [Actinomycetota bacterium]
PATLGLPERADAGRNYDYRYVWLRDQAYAGLAAGVHQPLPLMDEATAFTTARILEHGDKMAPAYRLDGSLPPKEEVVDLPGYPGGQVKVGNWVRGQFQLDSCGEMLQLYATSARHDHLGSDDFRAIKTIVDTIEKRWNTPDAGVWELDDAWWTQSRLACVAGLRTIADQVGAVDTVRVLGLADAIMAETSKRCLGPDGAWQQAPDRPGVDAALLLPPVRGALSATDPRSLATLKAVTEQLVQDGYAYRYAVDGRPLGEAEGAFMLCGFAMCLAQLGAGDTIDAFRWFERQRAACGPAGLLSEEFDVRQRQLRGNLPQGFVHALLLECSQRLGATSH